MPGRSPAWLAFTFARSTVLAPSAVTLTLIAVPFVLIVGFLIAGDLRLHGGPHRRVEQPDLRRRHSVDRASARRCSSLAVSPTHDDAARARRVRAVRHGDRLRLRDDLERQPAGSEDRPARRRVADAPADRAHRRRRRRRGGDSVRCSTCSRKAYGFAGAANVGVVAPNPLPAPQATLISALAQGVIGGNLDWKMIGIGALVGVGLILLDATLGAMKKLRIPPLAVGIGIYLPMSATFAVVVGAVISHWYDGARAHDAEPGARRAARARSSRRG